MKVKVCIVTVETCLVEKIYRKTRYFVKDKLAWDVHSTAGRKINRRYKPLKVKHITVDILVSVVVMVNILTSVMVYFLVAFYCKGKESAGILRAIQKLIKSL